jgi:hypothetical protein
MQRQQQHAEHAVGAVDEGEALFRLQDDRWLTDRGEGLARRAPRPVGVAHVALADQRQRHMGQRRQVTGAAEAAVLRDDRRDAVVEQSGDRPRRL